MNLARSLEYAAERYPEREAVVDGDVRPSFVELRRQAARLAGALADLGLGRGERLAAVLRNRHEAVSLYWAAQWLGATFVPLSWRASPAEVDYCIEDSEARLVATEEDGVVSVGDTAFPLLLEGDEHPGARLNPTSSTASPTVGPASSSARAIRSRTEPSIPALSTVMTSSRR